MALLLLVFQVVDPPAWLPGDGEVELVSPGGGVQMQLAPNPEDSESGPGYLTGPMDDYTPMESWSEQEVIRLDIESIAGPGYEMPNVEDNAGNSSDAIEVGQRAGAASPSKRLAGHREQGMDSRLRGNDGWQGSPAGGHTPWSREGHIKGTKWQRDVGIVRGSTPPSGPSLGPYLSIVTERGWIPACYLHGNDGPDGPLHV